MGVFHLIRPVQSILAKVSTNRTNFINFRSVFWTKTNILSSLNINRTMVTYAHARVVDKQKHLHFLFEYEHRFELADGQDEQMVDVDPDSTAVVKQFSSKRPMDEKVGKFLDRLKLNLNTFLMDKLNKKFQKLLKKKKEIVTESDDGSNKHEINQVARCLQQLRANQVAVELLLNNKPIDRELLNEQVFNGQHQLQLCVGQHSYQIVLNAPYIKSFKLPKLILAQHPVFALLTVELGQASDCDYRWYRRRRKQKWELMSQEFYYTPNEDAVGDHVKVEVVHRTGDRINFQGENEAKDVVKPAPRESPFLERHKLIQHSTVAGQFRCVSYNMLADFYADSDYSRTVLFPYCPPEFLSMDYRQHLLLKELVGYNGDLICLQEVDKNFFNHSLSPFLKFKNNLQGELCLKAGNLSEGLATFYNQDKFRLLDQERHVFTELIANDPLFEDIWKAIEINEQLSKRIDLKTVFQVLVLESVQRSGHLILLVNTHLYSKADADHIRLLQASIILRHLEQLHKKWSSKSYRQVSSMVMGDFNSTPECGVYQLFTTGKVCQTSEDWKSNADEAVINFSMEHSLKFASACGTPEYTNYTPDFQGCLDYIFVDTNNFNVDKIYPLIDHQHVIASKAIPNEGIPSDHLALVCDLSFK